MEELPKHVSYRLRHTERLVGGWWGCFRVISTVGLLCLPKDTQLYANFANDLTCSQEDSRGKFCVVRRVLENDIVCVCVKFAIHDSIPR